MPTPRGYPTPPTPSHSRAPTTHQPTLLSVIPARLPTVIRAPEPESIPSPVVAIPRGCLGPGPLVLSKIRRGGWLSKYARGEDPVLPIRHIRPPPRPAAHCCVIPRLREEAKAVVNQARFSSHLTSTYDRTSSIPLSPPLPMLYTFPITPRQETPVHA